MNNYEILQGDCVALMSLMLPDNSIDAIVTDPPYELGFMGKKWDNTGIANNPAVWAECLRVLKPGGHLLAFSGSRTYHRMACAIEDAGFEIRDQIMWLYGSGFPKSLDVSKAIDKAAGAEREVVGSRSGGASNKAGATIFSDDAYSWSKDIAVTAPSTDAALRWEGWGTALKPAHEPICVARKPLIGTVAANVLQHGTGAINIDGCRVATNGEQPKGSGNPCPNGNADIMSRALGGQGGNVTPESGRWPANIIHDGSDEVLAAFPNSAGQLADASDTAPSAKTSNVYGAMKRTGEPSQDNENNGVVGFKMKPGARRLDTGSAARFFYCAKASKTDRSEGNTHPTVKPTGLMAYLCRLVTPPGGTVLDPFMGSGSTGKACMREGFAFIGIEMQPEYVAIAEARIAHEQKRKAA